MDFFSDATLFLGFVWASTTVYLRVFHLGGGTLMFEDLLMKGGAL